MWTASWFLAQALFRKISSFSLFQPDFKVRVLGTHIKTGSCEFCCRCSPPFPPSPCDGGSCDGLREPRLGPGDWRAGHCEDTNVSNNISQVFNAFGLNVLLYRWRLWKKKTLWLKQKCVFGRLYHLPIIPYYCGINVLSTLTFLWSLGQVQDGTSILAFILFKGLKYFSLAQLICRTSIIP